MKMVNNIANLSFRAKRGICFFSFCHPRPDRGSSVFLYISQLCVVALSGLILAAGIPAWADESPGTGKAERHLRNIRQLTTGGKNAEAYFSFDGSRLIFQSTKDPASQTLGDCYQMYVMDLDGENVHRVSTGYGAVTCGYFFPGGRRVLYSSTHMAGLQCPPKPERGPQVSLGPG